MKVNRTKGNEDVEKKFYKKPTIRSEKEMKELSLNCPTTSIKYCGRPFTPKKG